MPDLTPNPVVAYVIEKNNDGDEVFPYAVYNLYASGSRTIVTRGYAPLGLANHLSIDKTLPVYIDGVRQGLPAQESTNALQSVFAERKRQNEKWGEQNHGDLYWLGIAAEEFGEVAKEIIEKNGNDAIREEVVHLTAVGLQYLEAIDRRTK